ncbi:MAG: type II secretion system minor pseudopilin GspH [Gammaproteobacteria bacterium]|nr:type II secretion system minor pseudopilin GspH [Gammaproteobacteria bacterium]
MNHSKSGFTLIELLVVLVIISIIAGVAVISVKTNSHRDSELFAHQLVNEITLAEQESLLRPATLGLYIYPDHWAFKRFVDADKNHPPSWQPIFNVRYLPSKLQLTLKNDQTENESGPDIVISPGGDLTPFHIFIGKKSQSPDWEIIGKANGEVSYHELNQE